MTTMWLTCQACGRGRTTTAIHSASEEECVCGLGSFYAPGWDRCIACQEHLTCPGELETPLVHAGYHAGFLPDKERTVEFEIWRCKVPAACPADGSLEPKLRLIGPCPNRLEGNGCSSCPDDFIPVDNYKETGIAGCAPCANDWRTRATLPSVVVVGLLLLCVTRQMSIECRCFQVSPENNNGGNLSRLVSIISNLLRKSKKTMTQGVALLTGYLLGISLVCELNAEFSPEVATALLKFELFTFDSGVLSAECVVGKSVGARYCAPLAVPLLLTILSVAVNKVTTRVQKVKDSLDGSRLYDRLGQIAILIYVLLAKWAAQFLEVTIHPNAPDTVVAFPEVDCQSHEHLSMLPGFVFGVFYIVSIPAYMVVLCYRAPKRFCSESFARSVQFLVSKWTPCSWWFSLVLLLRNLFTAMVSVIFVDGNQQLFSMGAVYIAYLYAAASVKPWKVSWFNIADSMISLWMGFVLMATMLSSASLRASERESTTNYTTTVACVSFIYVSVVLIFVLILGSSVVRVERIEAREKIVADTTRHALRIFATTVSENAAPLEDLERHSTDKELREIFGGIRTVLHECYCQELTTVGSLRIAGPRLFQKTAGEPLLLQSTPQTPCAPSAEVAPSFEPVDLKEHPTDPRRHDIAQTQCEDDPYDERAPLLRQK